MKTKRLEETLTKLKDELNPEKMALKKIQVGITSNIKIEHIDFRFSEFRVLRCNNFSLRNVTPIEIGKTIKDIE
jgi:hypothetical protein